MVLRILARHPRTLAFLAALTSGLLLLLILHFDARPHTLPPAWQGPPGQLEPRPPLRGGALLVLDPKTPGSGAAFSDLSASAAWTNWLTQSIGPFRWCSSSELTRALESPPELLIVSSSASQAPSEALLARVDALVRQGMRVLFELPHPAWLRLSGLELLGMPQAAGRVTRLELPFPSNAFALITRIVLPTRIAQARAHPALTPLLWVDDVPVLLERSLENGLVLSSSLDLARLWQSLQQGVPDPDGQVRNRYPELHSAPLETNDLVADPALLTADAPIADLLEDMLFQRLNRHRPIAAWWHFAHAAPGAFLMSHDEEGMGDRSSWMAEANAAAGCPSTYFVVASPAITRQGMQRIQSAGAELGLHYVLPGPDGEDYPGSGYDLEGRFQSYGLWKLRPLRQLLAPLEQLEFLRRLAGETPVDAVTRTHFLAWTPRFVDLFRAFSKAGVLIDSSYGPDLKDRGYLFGTARPFRPLDLNGLPLPVLELPFVSAEDLGGADGHFLSGLLERSANQDFQALSVLYHPNAFKWHPSVSNYLTWRGLCQQARHLGHWITTFANLARFTHAREQATLHSSWSEDPSGDRLELSYHFPLEGGTLALPAFWGDRRLELPTRDPALGSRELLVAGTRLRLLELPAGSGTLVVYYTDLTAQVSEQHLPRPWEPQHE